MDAVAEERPLMAQLYEYLMQVSARILFGEDKHE